MIQNQIKTLSVDSHDESTGAKTKERGNIERLFSQKSVFIAWSFFFLSSDNPIVVLKVNRNIYLCHNEIPCRAKTCYFDFITRVIVTIKFI